ncbi:putative DNA polymerase [Frankliniella fusca]|uniref:DNA-directed DNA polymerase n=1 Tax=Frankliniella fusca TaxID=407009 RepID=A0AAE1HPT4_9NEOP|nr:putative DNA polymerase [Frankliniella fusca]
MCGAGSNAPPRPATPPPRPATPPAGPSRARSPQPGPSKRPREENEKPEEDQPTLEVLQSRERELKRFKTKFREETIQISGLGDTLPSEEVMEGLFDTVLQRQREAVSAKDDDRVIVEIQNAENVDNPLWFSMRRADQINGRVVLDKLARVLNSNQAFMAQGQLKVSYIHIPTPEAGGRRRNRVANETMEQWIERKTGSKGSIYSPENTDNMCLTRCVAVLMALGGMHKQAFYKLKQPNSVIQRDSAKKLCENAHIDPAQPCGLDEVRKLQDSLPDYRLCVFTDKDGKECVFKGPHGPGRKNLCLLLHNNHFYALLYPGAAFDRHFTCDRCVVFYNNTGDHRCEGACWRCFAPAHHDGPLRRCGDCGHQFAGDECFNTHKTVIIPHTDRTKCQTFKFCQGCEKSYSVMRGQRHVCGFVYCSYCKNNVAENHLCYMQPWAEKEKKRGWKYITVYYDIETTQHTPVEGKPDTYEHIPNLLVCQAVCEECAHIPHNDYFCTVCQTRQHIFHSLDDPNLNVMGQFFDYLQSFGPKTKILLAAHNSRSFDGVFVTQEAVKRKLKCEVTLQGAKILCMEIGNWKFIDSLMFLPMPLSAMPKSFGLTELKKGYWPFMANKPEYYTYEGPLLDKHFYCVSTMKQKAVAEFKAWHDEQTANGFVFNFRRELIDYCISDVTILRQACHAFRSLFEQTAGFDPMFNCMTLSSACMAAFRRNFLKPDTIGIVPPGGYHGRGKQSHIALTWLDYESHKLGTVISTIYTDREISVLGRRVDGYIELPLPDGSLERRIYQFHGCYWHHCPIHFPANEDSGENRFEKTQQLTSLFRRSGYTVIEKWECEFKSDLASDPDTKAYFEAHPTTRTPPLGLRDALAGGRTSALKWYYKADLAKGEKIKMVDVVSEYPNANLRGEYPYGHPTLYLEGDPDMPPPDTWNGVIKCTVLPPRDLYLPVLPYKAKGKLMFPLCRTCVEEENTEMCHHNDPQERQLTDTWCAPELLLALREKGYTLVEVHEVYQYPRTSKYNADTREDGLLSAYVRRFMALKIQASGWPPECDTEEKQAKFVEDTLKHDGVVLDPTKMEKNPALRALSKLMLNSFWGKFGEKTLRPKTEFLYDYAKLIALVTDNTKEVTGLLPLSDECLQVTWKPVEDSEVSLPTSSLLHAAYTTCHGRMQLYKYLDVVKERALYHDTDSVAYISRPGESELPLGTHLGDLTDQIEEDYGPGSFITEFVAGGPKNYAYKVAVGGDVHNIKVCIKVRGISINTSCDDLVTFDNLKVMVMGSRDKITVPIPHQIARLPGWRIVTRHSTKNWQALNTKRRRVDVANTVPHGYNAWTMAPEEDQDLLEVMELLGDA